MDNLAPQQFVPELRKGILSDNKEDLESAKILPQLPKDGQAENENNGPPSGGGISSMGLKVLVLLAFQNCFKNILMRFVMKDQPSFLLSTAVITIESLKLLMASVYIVLVEKQSLQTIISFIIDHKRNTMLLCIPASAYSLQMSLEYIAFANIDAATFSVLVQTKMLTTAFFFRLVLKRKLRKKQVLSLVLLTIGVMLCNMKDPSTKEEEEEQQGNAVKGILASLGEKISISPQYVISITLKNNHLPTPHTPWVPSCQVLHVLPDLPLFSLRRLLNQLKMLMIDRKIQEKSMD